MCFGIDYWCGADPCADRRRHLRHAPRAAPCCRWLTGLDHLYGLLLTFGLALIIQGVFQNYFGSSGLPYAIPANCQGGMNLGFMFLPIYRAWVMVFSLVVCFATWF